MKSGRRQRRKSVNVDLSMDQEQASPHQYQHDDYIDDSAMDNSISLPRPRPPPSPSPTIASIPTSPPYSYPSTNNPTDASSSSSSASLLNSPPPSSASSAPTTPRTPRRTAASYISPPSFRYSKKPRLHQGDVGGGTNLMQKFSALSPPPSASHPSNAPPSSLSLSAFFSPPSSASSSLLGTTPPKPSPSGPDRFIPNPVTPSAKFNFTQGRKAAESGSGSGGARGSPGDKAGELQGDYLSSGVAGLMLSPSRGGWVRGPGLLFPSPSVGASGGSRRGSSRADSAPTTPRRSRTTSQNEQHHRGGDNDMTAAARGGRSSSPSPSSKLENGPNQYTQRLAYAVGLSINTPVLDFKRTNPLTSPVKSKKKSSSPAGISGGNAGGGAGANGTMPLVVARNWAPEGINDLTTFLNMMPTVTAGVKARRNVPTNPERVLDAPGIMNDFYVNVLDWSANNVLVVGLVEKCYLWHEPTGAVNHFYSSPHHDDYISACCFSPDGRRVAVGTDFGSIRIFDVSEKFGSPRYATLITSIHLPEGVSALGWSTANVLATGDKSGTIRCYEIHSSSSPSSSRNASASNMSTSGVHLVRIWDGGHTDRIVRITWDWMDPLSRVFATGGNDNLVNLWDITKPGGPKMVFRDHTSAVRAVSFCPWQRNLLATGGGVDDQKIRFYNTETGALLKVIDTGSQVCSILWSRAYRELVSTHDLPKDQIVLWSYPSLQKVAVLPGHTTRPLHMAMSPDGQSIVTAGGDENLK
ncbi:hypothetical protein HK102_013592, partial [Quaeritorhiza haematococci]